MSVGNKPVAPVRAWGQMVQKPCAEVPKETLTTALDKFSKDNRGAERCSILFMYMKSVPSHTNLSQLLQAQLVYLCFQGDNCPLFYSSSNDTWYMWDQC
jgi:hypothetical protein